MSLDPVDNPYAPHVNVAVYQIDATSSAYQVVFTYKRRHAIQLPPLQQSVGQRVCLQVALRGQE